MIPEISVIFLRAFAAACYTAFLWFAFRRSWNMEHSSTPSQNTRARKKKRKNHSTSAIGDGFALTLPIMLAVFYINSVLREGWQHAPASLFRFSTDLLLTLSIYYLVMLMIMPALQRRFSARACAAVWLLPTYLYLVIMLPSGGAMPRLVIYCPSWIIDLFVPIWFGGFVLIFAGFLVSNVLFCRRIRRTAADECDAQTLAVWEQERERLGFEFPVRLVRCPLAVTPFSMKSRRKLWTVLPQNPYTEDELRLIFRHELHHIRREDMSYNIFFAFLRALLWFHPLVWVAARQSSRDMERSCDEIVLEGADDHTRKLYATLLLQTAGKPAGFTTCLSADAKSLRFRLNHVVQEQGRFPGTKLVAALLFTCIFFHGTFTVSDERYTLEELLVNAGAVDHFLYEIYDWENSSYQSRNEADLKAGAQETLFAYLRSLPVERLTGSTERPTDTPPQNSPRLYFSDGSGRVQGIWLYDNGATIYNWYRERGRDRIKVYYVREQIDWEMIESCFQPLEKGGFAHE